MDKFIYVFTKESFNKLSKIGFRILKADENNSIYVFENKQELSFELSNDKFLCSNTLTF